MQTKANTTAFNQEQQYKGKKMPINAKKMKSLKEQYGSKKGEDVYYALEQKAKTKKKKTKPMKQTKFK